VDFLLRVTLALKVFYTRRFFWKVVTPRVVWRWWPTSLGSLVVAALPEIHASGRKILGRGVIGPAEPKEATAGRRDILDACGV
jgi:hypothetical protein